MSARSAAFSLRCDTILRKSRRAFEDLVSHEVLAPAELADLQSHRALAQARFAMEHTRFYRDLYRDAGFTVDDLHDPAAFDELPVIDKAQVREHGELFRSDEATPHNSKRVATGGSTGQPLAMTRDLRVQARAFEWRLLRWWGVHPYDDTAIVYRFFRTPRETLQQKVVWWPSRRFQLDALTMDDTTMGAFLTTFRRVQPPFLIGYVGAIVELAHHVL